ncbi:MAG: L-threonylcarbamoyladenylate synthase [Bacteroidota bacterium]|jgi:L-threonylcarbamoyladenylate synthase
MPITKIIQFFGEHLDPDDMNDAVAMLRSGGLVAFPTETVYGIGADAFNPAAVKKIFEAKGRPSDNPLIVHVASLEIAWHFTTEISDKGLQLAKHFWPGPLTLVVRRKAIVPDIVTAGLDTVAIRIPNHPVTLELLKRFEGGIVGPSANISGRPSPTAAEHVYHDLNGKIDIILDAGPTTIGMESTVIDVTLDPPVILRIGGLSREDIEKEIGETRRTSDQEILRRSPGTRHRHYAPKAHIVLIPKNDRDAFVQQLSKMKDDGKKVGTITYSEDLNAIDTTRFHIILSSSVERYGRNIFRALRELDNLHVDCMIVESVEEKGIGAAIMDRLSKAAQNI